MLRSSESASNRSEQLIVETKNNSFVIQITNGSHVYRQCHLVSLLPITLNMLNSNSSLSSEKPQIGAFQLSYEAAGYLAAKHLNERNSPVLPQLKQLVHNCDIRFTYQMYNTQADIRIALTAFLDAMLRNHSLQTPKPTAIIGEAASKVSTALANLAGVFETPQISASSTATNLDDKAAYPFFSRMVSTNDQDARALMIYLKHLGVTHFGCIHVRDTYGLGFRISLIVAARQYGLTMYPVEYDYDDYNSLVTAMEYLKSTQVRYFFGVFHHESRKAFLEEGFRIGMMGSAGFVWILSENHSAITSEEFELDAATEQNLVKAVDGMGVLKIAFPQNSVLDALLSDFSTDLELQRSFVAAHGKDTSLFDTFNFTENLMIPSSYVNLVYDAVITLGVSACQQEDRFFNGSQLLHSIRNQKFEGSSGLVSFDNVTGTRDEIGLEFTLTNIIISQNKSDNEIIRFDATQAIAIGFPDVVRTIGPPFIYAGGITTSPPGLPAVEVEEMQILYGVQIFALMLCAFCMIAAVACGSFAFRYRRKAAVRAAQPEFLYLISLGCFILTSAIIPMSLQEPLPEAALNVACMSVLYQFSIGFVCAFSALFCKTWRLNKLVKGGERCRRIKVEFKDVMLPFVFMLSINLIILLSWTFVDPLKWTKNVQENSEDKFGRTTTMYPTCSSSDPTNETIFYSLFYLTICVAVVFANWECYKARNNPTHFNETGRIAVSMFIILEAVVIGGPVLLTVWQAPNANYLVRCLLIFVICLGILIPMFAPLYLSSRGQFAPERRRFLGSVKAESIDCSMNASMNSSWNTSTFRNLLRKISSTLSSTSLMHASLNAPMNASTNTSLNPAMHSSTNTSLNPAMNASMDISMDTSRKRLQSDRPSFRCESSTAIVPGANNSSLPSRHS